MTFEDFKLISIAFIVVIVLTPVCYASFNHSVNSTNPAWEVLFVLTLLGIGLHSLFIVGMIGMWIVIS